MTVVTFYIFLCHSHSSVLISRFSFSLISCVELLVDALPQYYVTRASYSINTPCSFLLDYSLNILYLIMSNVSTHCDTELLNVTTNVSQLSSKEHNSKNTCNSSLSTIFILVNWLPIFEILSSVCKHFKFLYSSGSPIFE